MPDAPTRTVFVQQTHRVPGGWQDHAETHETARDRDRPLQGVREREGNARLIERTERACWSKGCRGRGKGDLNDARTLRRFCRWYYGQDRFDNS
jgi:hypothetical protein